MKLFICIIFVTTSILLPLLQIRQAGIPSLKLIKTRFMKQQIVFGLSSQAWNCLSLEERQVLLDLHKKALERLSASQSVAYEFHAASQQAKRVYAL